jgi:pyridoxamine 5'-phosphate oxidase family protein
MDTQSTFSPAEVAYLTRAGRHLGRIATVGHDGTPHVVPAGWVYNDQIGTIDVTGHSVERTKKFRDVRRSGRAAVVIDDVASTNPWRPRAVEIRGRAEAIHEPAPLIRIYPDRVVSWGLEP